MWGLLPLGGRANLHVIYIIGVMSLDIDKRASRLSLRCSKAPRQSMQSTGDLWSAAAMLPP